MFLSYIKLPEGIYTCSTILSEEMWLQYTESCELCIYGHTCTCGVWHLWLFKGAYFFLCCPLCRKTMSLVASVGIEDSHIVVIHLIIVFEHYVSHWILLGTSSTRTCLAGKPLFIHVSPTKKYISFGDFPAFITLKGTYIVAPWCGRSLWKIAPTSIGFANPIQQPWKIPLLMH